MIDIDQDFVDSSALNPGAIKNGRGLVMKNKFVKLHKSDDETLIFGECSGSGKSNYFVSCDFVQPDKPVHRCNCPSRQFPCKHCVGLMYAWVDGKTFTVADVPEDVASKREKIEKRVEKKKAAAKKPRKVNKTALLKKITLQLEGLNLLEKLTFDLLRMGMGNTNAKTARQIEEQAKQLGNSHLPGAQAALHNYTKLFVNDEGDFDSNVKATQREHVYGEAFDQLTRLHSLVKQGRAYLKSRSEDPELKPETETAIAAWLGHAWQLRELSEVGLVQENVELIQLAFNSYDDVARREFVETGIWMNLGSGAIQLTQNYRPYRAARFIKEEDSFFKVAQIKELCVYPGDVNPRVRWDSMLPRNVDKKDYQTVRKHGHSDFAALIKAVKGQLKGPLADKRPIYALNFTKIGQIGDDLVVEDGKGERLVFTETGMAEEPKSCHLLPMLPKELHQKQTLIARFHHDVDTRLLRVKPLSIVTKDANVRLTF